MEDGRQVDIQLAEDGNPILGQASEEGFVDCTFRIAKAESNDREYRLHLSASHRGETVGFDAIVVKGIRAGFDDEMEVISEHIYRDGVRFLRSGPESDRLMNALADLYELPVSDRRMVDSFTFTAIVLHQNDVNMESQLIGLKLFGNDGEDSLQEDYFESFFNVALSNGFAYWNEKDLDYRATLIRVLSTGSDGGDSTQGPG